MPMNTRVLRTPEELFANLPDFPYPPQYTDVGGLRIAHVEAGPAGAPPVLLLHGEPSWSFLYRKMMPILAAAGRRAVAPDLVGCGRSDKLADKADYSFQRHVNWITRWVQANDLNHITLVCQDWGALIGLRVAAENPARFDGIVLANGGLPTGVELAKSTAFKAWLEFSKRSPVFPVGRIISQGCKTSLSRQVKAAYDAPFPDDTYKAGVRIFPSLVPIRPDDPGAEENRRAWEVLRAWKKPFLTAFSDGDPITRGGERAFQSRVPGAQGQPHVTITGAGHFLQEDKGEELARVVVEFISS
jgi:haloalkane dehalogenase